MEQRRFSGKSQWYHETQSNRCQADIPSFLPETAATDDRFLLDLNVSATPLPAGEFTWLTVARRFASQLLPDRVDLSRLCTLSRYERLSTALTVAQVFGVQRLCHYYATHLAPESSSDSSRETNRRLTQITQFSRQLASQPTSLGKSALAELDTCGLSREDIVTFVQLIGFVSFQARVIALWQALHCCPVRQLPIYACQQDADRRLFISPGLVWQPAIEPLERRYATDRQKEILSCQDTPSLPAALAGILIHEPLTLHLLQELIRRGGPGGQLCPDDNWLVMMVVSRINGSLSCFEEAAARWQGCPQLPEMLRQGDEITGEWQQSHPREQAIIRATQILTRTPDRFSRGQLERLTEQGMTLAQSVSLLFMAALAGWLNRLKMSLGHMTDKEKTLSL